MRIGGFSGRPSATALSLAAGMAAAWLAAAAGGQEPAQDAGLATRYHAVERYATGPPREGSGEIGTTRSAFRETVKTVTDAAKGGAPERTEAARQAIWVERAAKVSKLDPSKVQDVVRRYEKVRVSPDPRVTPTEPPLLEGLTLWLENLGPGTPPRVYNLTPDRPLRSEEYRFLIDHVEAADLAAAILPEGSVLVGDTWRLSPQATQALIDANLAMGGAVGGGIVGRLAEVKPAVEGGRPVATITLTGQVQTVRGSTSLSARAEFEVLLRPPVNPATSPVLSATRRVEAVEARVALVRLSLAQEDARVLVAGDTRRRQDIRRELTFERQLDDVEAPEAPADRPEATNPHLWLSYTDPKGRFALTYPQEMVRAADAPPDALILRQRRNDGGDQVVLTFTPDGPPGIDAFFKDVARRWDDSRIEAIPGEPPRILPEEDWEGKRVSRGEAALRLSTPGPRGITRVHFYGYVVQSGGKAGLTVEATTTQDPPLAFRDQVEQILKGFRFDAAPSTAARTRPSP